MSKEFKKYSVFADFIGQHKFIVDAENEEEAEEEALEYLDEVLFDKTASLDEMNLQNLVVDELNPEKKYYRVCYFPDVASTFYVEASNEQEAQEQALKQITWINEYLVASSALALDCENLDFSVEECVL